MATTTPDAIREIKRMGFKTVVNLRLASEQGALVDEEGAIVRSLGMTYVHLPFNIQTPDPKLVENFIAAVAGPANTPAYVHCAAGGRAAALWMIKRVKADGWTQARGARRGQRAWPERPPATVRAQLPQGPPVDRRGARLFHGRRFDFHQDVRVEQRGHAEQRAGRLHARGPQPRAERPGGLKKRRHVARVVVQAHDVAERERPPPSALFPGCRTPG